MSTILQTNYDLCIVGAGLAGLSLACALGNSPLKILLIDAKAEPEWAVTDPQDLRSLALSFLTQKILERLNCWSELQAIAQAIEMVHISEKGRFGISRIKASDYGVDALGYVVSIEAIAKALLHQLHQQKTITVIRPAQVTQIECEPEYNRIYLSTEQGQSIITTQMVIAADGQQSTLAQLLEIKSQSYDFKQKAVLGNVGLSQKHSHIAYERFIHDGAVALLPNGEHQYAFVLTLKNPSAEHWLNKNDATFLQDLQELFGYRLGRFTWVGRRQSYPLKQNMNLENIKNNVVFIGNASHSIHPIAAQGFNLGIRDVMILADQLLECSDSTGLFDAKVQIYQNYLRERGRDTRFTAGFTNMLTTVFSNEFMPLRLLRNLGLLAFDQSCFTKHMIAKKLMGLNFLGLDFFNPIHERLKAVEIQDD